MNCIHVFFSIFSSFAFIGFFMLIASITLSLGFIFSAQEMHRIMLKNVFHWPMALFDTTPMGRILNRFSKDVEAVDNILPMIFRSGMMMFFSVNFHFDFKSSAFFALSCVEIICNNLFFNLKKREAWFFLIFCQSLKKCVSVMSACLFFNKDFFL